MWTQLLIVLCSCLMAWLLMKAAQQLNSLTKEVNKLSNLTKEVVQKQHTLTAQSAEHGWSLQELAKHVLAVAKLPGGVASEDSN